MRTLTTRGLPRQREYVTTRASRGMSIVDRINLHTKVDANGCWVWQLALVDTGYGHLTVDTKVLIAHRASYEALVGPIPDGLELDHLCRNRACVNPSHLEPVTPKVNQNRSPFCRSRITHCPQGHEYTPDNTATYDGRRACRICRVAYLALYRALTPAQRVERKAAGLPVVDLAAHFADQEAVA